MGLKTLRKGSQLTQFDLAQRSGVSRSTIARLETTDILPRLETAQRLAAALGCTLDELVGTKEQSSSVCKAPQQ